MLSFTQQRLAAIEAVPSVDYLTVTATTEKATSRLLHDLMQTLGSSFLHLQPYKKWSFMGYHGRAYHGVRYGLKGTMDSIVMLSGSKANELYATVAPSRVNCTRVDLAVTVSLPEVDNQVAKRAYDNISKGGQLHSSMVMNSNGGSTTYVGSRSSKFFGRLYDKGAEQGTEPGKFWRYELETKKPAAEAVLAQLLSTENPGTWILRYVFDYFNTRGIIPLYLQPDIECVVEMDTNISTPGKTLHWLTTQVAPAVGKLIIGGFEAEVREALGLPFIDNKKH